MQCSSHSPLVSAGMCLRILRRLLDDESVVLLQLSYLVENIHNPLLHDCDPVYLKHLPELPPMMPAAMVRVLSRRAANTQVCADCSTANSGPLRLLPPQPVTVKASPSSAPAGVANRKGKMASGKVTGAGGKAATGREAAKAVAPAPRVLSFAEYWELFANLPTLYSAQHAMVRRLEATVRAVTALLDRLQGEREMAEVAADMACEDDGVRAENANQKALNSVVESSGSPVTATGTKADGPTTATRNGGNDAPPTPLPIQGPLSAQERLSSKASGTHGTCAGDERAFTELGAIIVDFFGSDELGRVVAEHTMYAVHYTSKAAPKLLEVSRLWRRSGGGAAGATPATNGGMGSVGVASSSPVAVPSALSPIDRELLLHYSGFLDFLFRSFGESGVPTDSRVKIVSLPELKMDRAGGGDTRSSGSNGKGNNVGAGSSAAGDVATQGSGGGGGGGVAGAGTVRGQMMQDASVGVGSGLGPSGGANSSTNAGAGGGSGTASGSKKQQQHASRQAGGPFSPLPSHWNGFSTMIILLATPLSCLRRLNHVARCLIESRTLLPATSRQLQSQFVAHADAQMSEESALIMEELAQHDVRTIMSLIDDSSSAVIVGADGATTAGENGVPLLSQFRNHDGTRLLVHYGRLSKRAGRGKHERLMFLFTDWICYVEELSSGRMRLRGAMPLDTLRVIDVADSPALDVVNCFELINAQTKRLIFLVSTPEQKRHWVDAIRFAVRQQSRARLRAKLAATNASGIHSGAAVAAAAADRGLFHCMEPSTASAPLSHRSRLCRQHRYDHAWQDRMDTQAAQRGVSRAISPQASLRASGVRMSEAAARPPPTPQVRSPPVISQAAPVGADGGGSTATATATAGLSTAVVPEASLSEGAAGAGGAGGSGAAVSHDSRGSNYGQIRGVNTHRQLEYDVTSWARQSATNRRQRSSQDLVITTTSNIAGVTLGTHSRHSSLASVDSSGGAGGDGALSTASAGANASFHANAAGGSSPAPGLVGTSPSAREAFRAYRNSQTSSPFMSIIPHPSSRAESLGGGSNSSRPPPVPNTPLRRPVSERFEVGPSSTTTPANSTPVGSRAKRAASLPTESAIHAAATAAASAGRSLPPAAAPPRVPPSAAYPSPRTRHGSFGGTSVQRLEDDRRGGEEGVVPPVAADVDSHLSSLILSEDADGKVADAVGEEHAHGRSVAPESRGGDHRVGSDFDAEGLDEPIANFASLDDLCDGSAEVTDPDENREEDESVTSESIVEEFTTHASNKASVLGDAAPSEDVVEPPFAAQRHAQDASPTNLDEEVRVTSAFTAFCPRDTTAPSGSSYSPPRHRPTDPMVMSTCGDDAGAASSELGSTSAVDGGATAGKQRQQQRFVDPSRDLEAIFQQEEDEKAIEEHGQNRSDGNDEEAASSPVESGAADGLFMAREEVATIDDGSAEYDAGDKDLAAASATVDSSLDIDDDDVKKQE